MDEIRAVVRRGLVAGVLAGLLTGAFGFFLGEPPVDAAIAREEEAASHSDGGAGAGGFEFSRGQQRAGLVVGALLAGAAVGTLFGLAGAWSVGRVEGSGWTRSLKLGAVAVGTLIVLPSLKYPPNPPGVGDPATVGTRTTLYLGLVAYGLLLVAAGWMAGRRLRAAGWSAPARQALVGAGVLVAVTVLATVLPAAETAGSIPADLLWRFRLSSIGTQAVLWAGTAVAFGLLTARAETLGVSSSGRGAEPPGLRV